MKRRAHVDSRAGYAAASYSDVAADRDPLDRLADVLAYMDVEIDRRAASLFARGLDKKDAQGLAAAYGLRIEHKAAAVIFRRR
ncbi:MAG: hypothetical protein F4Z31_10425 [Gemmatimonadetes bacterium]|nr:hypothetical protein [Gemmatimonadota bacterium]MYJ12515.1 hypothetical protein [Gemmatimonadota bacterium]